MHCMKGQLHIFAIFNWPFTHLTQETPLETVWCVTVRVVSQLLLQLHSPLLQFIQLLLQLTHLHMDVLYWDVLV